MVGGITLVRGPGAQFFPSTIGLKYETILDILQEEINSTKNPMFGQCNLANLELRLIEKFRKAAYKA